MKEIKKVIKINGKDVEISTGKIGVQAAGSIMLRMGGTVMYATASIDRNDTQQDFFPLSIEYIEKMYARGAMSGSKYTKREGLPNDEAIIKARQVDHSIRSLFPKSFRRPVTVVLTIFAYDGINDPEILAVTGASLALMQSGVPFYGPASSTVAGVTENDEIIINPEAKGREGYKAEFSIAGVDGKILNLEGWAKEVSDETMDKVMDEAMKVIIETNRQQKEFIDEAGKTLDIDPAMYPNKPAEEELIDIVIERKYDAIKKEMFIGDKVERNNVASKIKEELTAELAAEESKFSAFDIDMAVEYVRRKALREGIMKEDKRVSGRKLDEIRPLKAEVDTLPTVHGSALFSRGLTQALSIVTLASKKQELLADGMEGEEGKFFMHHYNMPAYANGEAGRFNYHPGRREIGHGAIGENALKNMVPSVEEFPYTVRAVSEVTSSNGSTSMAATCASSMALMAAGVPMKKAVAGIGVGLITEDKNEDNYKLILDIEGIEDFYGDMDFKVCGTDTGITAIQYENKLMGVKLDVLKAALRLANKGRQQVLAEMNKTIKESRKELSATAPQVGKIQIDTERIGELIGPGGKNIKELVASSQKIGGVAADIAVDDTGLVLVTTSNAEQMAWIKNRIEGMFKVASIGDIYEGTVDKVAPYGAFVDVSPSISGLVHVSEMSDKFVKDPTTIVKEGQKVKVKVIKVENGRISFSMKGVPQE